jgi:hypothetical protein
MAQIGTLSQTFWEAFQVDLLVSGLNAFSSVAV